MTLLREAIGDSLRRARLAQHRTLREVSTSARVSLGYLSEVERGRKEASSELLAAICAALDVPLSRVLWDVSTIMAGADAVPAASEPAATPVQETEPSTAVEPVEAPAAAASEPGLAPAGANMSAEPGARPSRIAEKTRIVIPAPKSDMLILVKTN
ncbi:helix-turn-helix transcriptional regulator [Nocardia sp. NPDC005366]|uniref:helix-turn-helix domain-containing protein n=1 Tax=Nocardia sp. NPDC005366 TaxID=3156878 RepID=UPI0033B230EA